VVLVVYNLPVKIIFGEKSFPLLFEELKNYGIKKPLLVCGKSFMVSSRFKVFRENVPRFELYAEIEPNPSVNSVDSGAKILNSKGCDAVIGIGGGSVLDASKVIACMKDRKKSCLGFYKKVDIVSQVPFFALPTTAGSGSEATKFAVLTKPDGSKKSVLPDDRFYAKVAIVDPELTYTCPPNVTASSGLDAFCQGIESYWAVNSTEETRKFSAEAISLAYYNLDKAVREPDRQVRHNMSLASLTSAKAFSQTGTTGCHQVSYAFTKYYGLVHGFAVAITLPWFLEFYSSEVPERCNEICKLIGAKNIEDAQNKIRDMMRFIGAPVSLREIGCKFEDFEKIVEMSVGKREQNPIQHKKSDLMRLLGEIF
jgi:alcohol dehydrogenase